MHRIISFIAIIFICVSSMNAQVAGIDTIQQNGSPDKYINIVIMGDGYTDSLQDKFIEDAKKMSNYLFTQSPWSDYKNYFNVYAIKVVSAEAGTKHPNTAPDCSSANVPVSNPDTYFKVTFDYNNIHRLVAPNNILNVVKVLSENFPKYDQAVIIANSPYYGGSGGTFATSTTNTNSNEVAVHEIGHSFAVLADEYYAGDNYTYERVNMTKNNDPTTVKWKNWLGFNEIGIYQHCCGGKSAEWYKPSTKCKMQSLGKEFCSVCQEATIEKIHALVNPIVRYSPEKQNISDTSQFLRFSLDEVMRPLSNSMVTSWTLNNTEISNDADSVIIDQSKLPNGIHTLLVTVTDTNLLQRINNHASLHFSTVKWTIDKKTSGTNLQSALNKVSWHISPNPATNYVKLEFESEISINYEVTISSMTGQIYKTIPRKKLFGKNSESIDISNMPAGVYIITIDFDGKKYSDKIIKL